jgi:hypothetical protein
VLLVVVTSCAKQLPPKGGDRDIMPPKILSSYPLMGATNYTEKSITMDFDEYVVTNSLTGELVVSPPLKTDPEIKMRGKNVTITWQDTLSDNTTYMFQFGEGIKDLNEGNVLDSNIFVFSTGPYIDSFSQSGKVIDAFTLKPIEDGLVMFYRADVDSLPLTKFPDHFSRTDKNGNYKINYLADKEYKAFVLVPINKGYTFDLPLEAIAFSDSLLKSVYVADTLPDNDSSTVFKLFVEPDTAQYLKNTGQMNTKGLYLSFNQPVAELVVTALDGTDISQWKEKWSPESDSIVYWFEQSIEYDSMRLELIFDDKKDTVFFRKYIEPVRKAKGGKGVGSAGLDLQMSFSGKLMPKQQVEFISQTPLVQELNLDGTLLISGVDTSEAAEYFDQSTFSLRIQYEWEKGKSYSVYFPDSAVLDVYGLKQDSSVFSFSVAEKESLGSLEMEYVFPDSIGYIFQLLDEKGNLINAENVGHQGEISLENLLPGKYQVRVIFDQNGNGFWDSGIYQLKQQPERIVFFDELIEIRENWVSEIEWILNR